MSKSAIIQKIKWHVNSLLFKALFFVNKLGEEDEDLGISLHSMGRLYYPNSCPRERIVSIENCNRYERCEDEISLSCERPHEVCDGLHASSEIEIMVLWSHDGAGPWIAPEKEHEEIESKNIEYLVLRNLK